MFVCFCSEFEIKHKTAKRKPMGKTSKIVLLDNLIMVKQCADQMKPGDLSINKDDKMAI